MVLPWYDNGCLRDYLKKVHEAVIKAEDGVVVELEKWVGQCTWRTIMVAHTNATVVADSAGFGVPAQ